MSGNGSRRLGGRRSLSLRTSRVSRVPRANSAPSRGCRPSDNSPSRTHRNTRAARFSIPDFDQRLFRHAAKRACPKRFTQPIHSNGHCGRERPFPTTVPWAPTNPPLGSRGNHIRGSSKNNFQARVNLNMSPDVRPTVASLKANRTAARQSPFNTWGIDLITWALLSKIVSN